jgi:acetyltransferase-like isoleucine patch superfamily enzyme
MIILVFVADIRQLGAAAGAVKLRHRSGPPQRGLRHARDHNVTIFVHPAGICESSHVGEGTRIWAFVHVLPGAQIGRDCNVCDGVFIENDVIIGDATTIKCGVQLWDGVRLGNRVFIGPNVSFCNDAFPRSKAHPASFLQTIVEDRASIGANATILPGLRIGYGAMIGAGAVVLNDVPPRSLVVGNPGRVVGYAEATQLDCSKGEKAAITRRGARMIQFVSHPDASGRLIAIESELPPFAIKRVYCIDEVTAGIARGAARRRCHQLLVAVAGEMKVAVDDAESAYVVSLDEPQVGLYLPPMIWSMQFGHSVGAVLLVMASESHDPNDCITDYAEFRKFAQLQGACD